jgi:hypothetical protein
LYPSVFIFARLLEIVCSAFSAAFRPESAVDKDIVYPPE